MTSTEENYLAYVIGKDNLAADSGVGGITLTSTGNTSIGSFVDTFYNEAVGTHPASAITSGSTTTTLYQKDGTASIGGGLRPVGFEDDSNSVPSLYEFPDSDMNVLARRINSRIATSSYPGLYKLGSSSPGADYAIHISGAFSDTQTDGTTVPYNIYKRTAMTAPTTVRPVGLRSDGDLQELADSDISDTIGTFVRNLRATAGEIGSYQLRSATQGAPTDAGTWTAVGTATDTKKNTTESSYTRTRGSTYSRTRVSAYSRDRSSAYTRTSTRTRTSNYLGDFTGDYTRDFVGEYTRNFLGNYVGGNFVGNYAGNYTGNYSRGFAGNFLGNFARNYAGNFLGNYTRNVFSDPSTRTSTAPAPS